LAWAVIGTNLLDRVWQWPSREMCGRIGAAETRREGKLHQLEPQERAMVRHLLLKRLEDAAGAPVGATA
jgi:hypothetical protein